MASKVKAKKVPRQRAGRTSTSRISSKNQITIPVAILRSAGLSQGDVVEVKIKDQAIEVVRVEPEEHPLAALISKNYFEGFDLAKERAAAWPE